MNRAAWLTSCVLMLAAASSLLLPHPAAGQSLNREAAVASDTALPSPEALLPDPVAEALRGGP